MTGAADADSGAHLSLRCGPLLVSAEVRPPQNRAVVAASPPAAAQSLLAFRCSLLQQAGADVVFRRLREPPDGGRVAVRLQANRSTSQVDCQVVGLALDELELASLRGTVQEAALHVNFDTRMGRGKLNVAGPRFSGLQVKPRTFLW